jgi:hypothetical protein
MGQFEIDRQKYPKEPWLYQLVTKLARRVDGKIHLGRCSDAEGRVFDCLWVTAEDRTDAELAQIWEEARAEHRQSVRWGAGQRKRKRF